jgi:hypothetical protein
MDEVCSPRPTINLRDDAFANVQQPTGRVQLREALLLFAAHLGLEQRIGQQYDLDIAAFVPARVE